MKSLAFNAAHFYQYKLGSSKEGKRHISIQFLIAVTLTRLLRSPILEQTTGANSVHLKLECEQVTGSFKFRGALNKFLQILSSPPSQRPSLFTTSSSGNHALAFTAALKLLADRYIADGLPPPSSQIFLSEPLVAPLKLAKLRAAGANIVFHGDTSLDAEVKARRAAERAGGVYVSPYNDVDIMAGQGTTACEILEQLEGGGRGLLDYIYVPVGGGGLIGGIGSVLKATEPRGPEPRRGATVVVGSQPLASDSMRRSVDAGEIVDMEHGETLSDGTAGGLEPNCVTFPICQQVVDVWESVSEQEIAKAMQLVYLETGLRIEGAAGTAVAALLKTPREMVQGKNVVVVICGGNVAGDVFNRAMKM